MAKNASKSQILFLYKSLLRESEKFSNYNFRTYALRRIRDAFKESKPLSDPKMIKKQLDYGAENLQIIRRQVIVGDMYKTDKLVIENLR